MTSLLNHPLFTENSPSTSAAITLKGVLSILGVFTAARRSPSMASSRIRNCQISGILVASLTSINSKPAGIHSGLCMRSKKVGVIIYVMIAMRNLERRR